MWKTSTEDLPPVYANMLKTSQIHLINDEKECDVLFESIGDVKAVGFDCEWKSPLNKKETSEKRRKISLIQIALPDHVYLIHVHSIGKVPCNLQGLLQDPRVIKTGVNSALDAEYLVRDYKIRMENIFELANSSSRTGLRQLASSVLSVEMKKDKAISCSNWKIGHCRRTKSCMQQLMHFIPWRFSTRCLQCQCHCRRWHRRWPRSQKHEREKKFFFCQRIQAVTIISDCFNQMDLFCAILQENE
jgi:hypothetical protein